MKILKSFALEFLIITVLWSLYACKKDEDVTPLGDWMSKSDLDGVARNNAVSFVINNRAYVGLGYNPDIDDEYLTDWWEYNPDLDFWTQKADFSGNGRTSAVAFSLNEKGYVGTGYDGNERLRDFWEYSPTNNTWTRKADFGGSARMGAIAFAINGTGFIGTGYDGNNLKDFWEYTPTTDTWTQSIGFGGNKRINGFAFSIGNKIYLGGGKNNGVYQEDFWVYDGQTKVWTKKNDLNDSSTGNTKIPRESAITFILNNKAYLVSGTNGAILGDCWEYDPSLDTWDDKTDFEGVVRTEAIGFNLGNYGYILAGRNSTQRFDDLWAFDPTAEKDDDN